MDQQRLVRWASSIRHDFHEDMIIEGLAGFFMNQVKIQLANPKVLDSS